VTALPDSPFIDLKGCPGILNSRCVFSTPESGYAAIQIDQMQALGPTSFFTDQENIREKRFDIEAGGWHYETSLAFVMNFFMVRSSPIVHTSSS